MTMTPIPDAAVEAAIKSVESIIPNSNGVVWEFTHEDGQTEPVTLRYAMQAALTAALPLLYVPEATRRGDCICDYNPSTTDGPTEDCPQHGRPYSYWVERSDEAVAQVETLQQSNDHLRTVVDTWSDLYREAVGLPAEEHTRRRVEQMAEAVEQAQMETAAVRRLLLAARTPDDDAESKSATPERSTIGKGIARVVEPCLYCGNPVVSGDAVARSGPSDHWSHEDCYDTEHDAEGKS